MSNKAPSRIRTGRLTHAHSKTLIHLQDAYFRELPLVTAQSRVNRRALILLEAELRRAVMTEMLDLGYAWYAIGLQLGIQGQRVKRLFNPKVPRDGPYRKAVKDGKTGSGCVFHW